MIYGGDHMKIEGIVETALSGLDSKCQCNLLLVKEHYEYLGFQVDYGKDLKYWVYDFNKNVWQNLKRLYDKYGMNGGN